MTNWRPPRSVVERNQRAIRSMQNGSLDGRVVTAFPVKGQIPEEYDEFDDTEEENTENPGGPGKGILRPATEYFRVGDYPNLVFPLKKRSYVEVPELGRNYSTVHVYWNNLFQKDISFVLGGQQVYVRDPSGVLQRNDTFTVKYWWTEGGGGGPGPPLVVTAYNLSGWYTGGEDYARYGSFAANGVTNGTPGANGGAIGTISTLYTSVGFLTHFGAALQLKKGDHIDLDNAVDATVMCKFPKNANVSIFGYNYPGGKPGGIVAKKVECGLGGEVQGSFPASVPGDIASGAGAGVPVPGDIETHTGGAAINFAQLANVVADFDGNHQIIPIVMSDGGPNGSNSGCGGFGDPTFFDDTLYGLWTGHGNSYDGTFGATVIVTQLAEDD